MMLVQDVMTRDPVMLSADSTIVDAASKMRDAGIGPILVTDNGSLAGMVTDRDIVIRVIADGKDPMSTTLGDIATTNPVTLEPTAETDDAIKMMREHKVRRLPVVDHGKPVGIVSLGDLAEEKDPGSVLGEISRAPANN